MLGDIHIAEPGALICFAGPRVIQQTIREQLPEGFQRAEYLLAHGMIDMVVHRHKLRETLSRICRLLDAPAHRPRRHRASQASTASSLRQRQPRRRQADRDAPARARRAECSRPASASTTTRHETRDKSTGDDDRRDQRSPEADTRESAAPPIRTVLTGGQLSTATQPRRANARRVLRRVLANADERPAPRRAEDCCTRS